MCAVTVRLCPSLFTATEIGLLLLNLNSELDWSEASSLMATVTPRLLLALPTPTPEVPLTWGGGGKRERERERKRKTEEHVKLLAL